MPAEAGCGPAVSGAPNLPLPLPFFLDAAGDGSDPGIADGGGAAVGLSLSQNLTSLGPALNSLTLSRVGPELSDFLTRPKILIKSYINIFKLINC